MSEELKPVQQDPIAGEGAPAEVVETKTELEAEQDKSALDETVIADAIAALDNSDKALAAAEKRIIRDKRKAKEGGEIEHDDFEDRVAEEVARQLAAQIVRPEKDTELEAVQAQRAKNAAETKRLSELAQALKAKRSITNQSGGSNQDKLRPAIDLSKSLNDEQKALYQDIADRNELTLDAVLRLKAEAESKGESLIFYMQKKK